MAGRVKRLVAVLAFMLGASLLQVPAAQAEGLQAGQVELVEAGSARQLQLQAAGTVRLGVAYEHHYYSGREYWLYGGRSCTVNGQVVTFSEFSFWRHAISSIKGDYGCWTMAVVNQAGWAKWYGRYAPTLPSGWNDAVTQIWLAS